MVGFQTMDIASSDDLLSVGDAVDLLTSEGFPVVGKTLRRWCDAGKLPSIRTPGGQRRLRRSDVLALVAPAAPSSEERQS